jgi:hypothetical protein
MNYRILEASEWHRLKEIMEERFIPQPEAGSAAVAEDEDGKIVGVWFLQLAMHMEPLVLKSPKVNFKRLHDVLFGQISQHTGLRLYCFSDKDLVSAMAEHVGFRELPYKVFEKEVK